MTILLLDYVPLREPLWGSWNWWYLLLLPLSIGIGLTWKAMRLDDLSQLPRQALRATLMIVGMFLACAILLWGVMLLLEHWQ